MKTYIEIHVPIRKDEEWLSTLKNHLRNIPVRWQDGYYHITMAFVDVTPDSLNISSLLDDILTKSVAPSVVFDTLEAFTIPNGNMHFVCLSSKHIPQSLITLTESVREKLKEAGCIINTEFKLHVTLGRVLSDKIDLHTLQNRIDELALPSFELRLTDTEYREFRGKTIKHWQLS